MVNYKNRIFRDETADFIVFRIKFYELGNCSQDDWSSSSVQDSSKFTFFEKNVQKITETGQKFREKCTISNKNVQKRTKCLKKCAF